MGLHLKHTAVALLVLLLLLMMPVSQVVAGSASPLDDYYREHANGGGAQAPSAAAAPIDNDQYYTAPGQYIDTRSRPSAPGYEANTAPSRSKGCTTISDSPECLGD